MTWVRVTTFSCSQMSLFLSQFIREGLQGLLSPDESATPSEDITSRHLHHPNLSLRELSPLFVPLSRPACGLQG
jgi:hypothetical protein